MIRRTIALMLVLSGCVALVVGSLALFRSGDLQRVYTTTELPTIERTPGSPPTSLDFHSGEPVGMLQIPRLGLSSVVVEGDDAAALLLGVGHLPDTPLPWNGGNSVLAAHRDTFFRPLEHIRPDDLITFDTADASFEYVVHETMIVKPTAVEVLDPTPTDTLTLITCYPFNYIGSAPLRFIVRAERRVTGPAPRATSYRPTAPAR